MSRGTQQPSSGRPTQAFPSRETPPHEAQSIVCVCARRASVGTQADYAFGDEDVEARVEALARGFEEACRERDEALLLSRRGNQVRSKPFWGFRVQGSLGP